MKNDYRFKDIIRVMLNAVVEIELIKNADWLIDLGPEGGDGGGEIIGEGTPADIKKLKKSYTGKYL